MRKIVQIAVDSQPGGPDWNAWADITALCDDGSVWELMRDPDKGRVWIPVPVIPQDETS